MTPTVGSSSTPAAAASPFPAEMPAWLKLSPTSQGPKRYLKDFPDSAKTHIPAKKLTEVRDDFGNILQIRGPHKDRIVLEDPSETRLQKLARRSVLMEYSSAQAWALQMSIEAEFTKDEVRKAIYSVYDEINALLSPEAREIGALCFQIIMMNRINRDLLDKLDAMPRRKVTPWDVFCSFGEDISYLYSTAERNLPRVVVAVAALVFFCLYALRYSFLITQTSLLFQNNNAID